MPEALREFVAGAGRTPRSDEQWAIARAQRTSELHALAQHSRVIADPAPLMTAVYSEVYFHDDSLVDQTIAWIQDARLIVWCRPDFPWVAEPVQRDGPHARSAVDLRVGAHVLRLRAGGVRVLEAHGTRGDRLAAVRRALSALDGPRNLD